MPLETASTHFSEYNGHVPADFCADHHLMLELLRRFEYSDNSSERQELMRLVVDLFDVHMSIAGQSLASDDKQISPECEAIYGLMELVEVTNARSRIHYSRGLQLKRTFEQYAARQAILAPLPAQAISHPDQENSGLWRQRADLLAFAEQLMRLH